jgi:hypothetical protein
LSQYTSKISGTQEQFLSDSLWGDYIEQWKMGLDRQPESCYGGYYPEPRIVPAGTYFCVTKYNEVAAKPGDEFIAYVDYDNDIPELNEMDNRVAFTVYPKASKPCGSLLMCLWEQNKRAMIREVSKMKDQFKQVNEYMVMGLHGPEPISNSFLFGPGERVVMPPDASGHYSSDAFADPYIENKATSTDPTLH